jgi:hypothetical protein
MTKTIGFGEALAKIQTGHRVARLGWNGKDMWVKLERAGVMEPFLCMKTADNKFVPWSASVTDLLATDWVVVGFENLEAK